MTDAVKVTGVRDMQLRLIEVAARGGDARPILRKIAVEFRDDQRAGWARGGRPKWKPLSPKYAAQKAREGRSPKVGVYTGRLRASLLNKYDPHNLEVVEKDRLRVGTTDPVGNLFNGKHTVHKQPKRKLISLTPTRRREYLQMVQDYLAEGRS